MDALTDYTNATHVYITQTPSPRVRVIKDNLVDAVASCGVCAKHRSCVSVHPEHWQNGYYLVFGALLFRGFIGVHCGHLCGFKQYTCRESELWLNTTDSAIAIHGWQCYMDDSAVYTCTYRYSGRYMYTLYSVRYMHLFVHVRYKIYVGPISWHNIYNNYIH